MEEKESIFGNNSIKDVSWLCSLSESELDMLISLKALVIKRACVIGHEELAEKFDVKMLRALGFVLMDYLKENLKDLQLVPGSAESAAFMDSCNLLKPKLDDIMDIEELKTYIGLDSRKRPSKRPRENDVCI